MTTTTSSSNPNMSKNSNKDLSALKKSQFGFLYGFALRKSAGWTAIYSILLLLCYPLITWKENYENSIRHADFERNLAYYYTDHHLLTSFAVSALMCVMVLVFSAVLYSYMHGKRSADFFHSMPVDRGVMLGANFAAGCTALVVPIWITSLISMLSYPVFLPQLDWLNIWGVIGLEVLAWTMGAFILFAISTLVAVTVSTAVENVGYTVALLLEGSILMLIWDLACSSVFDTYVSIFSGGDVHSIFENLLYFLSPVFALGKVIVLQLDGISNVFYQGKIYAGIDTWMPLVFWLLLGAAALWMALKLYSKRQSERAEQWGRQSYIGFVVKLMSAIVGGFLFGVVFGDVLGLDSRFIFLFGALTGAPLVYLIIEAVTNRGFHNMKKCLPYLAASTGIIVVASLYFAFDGFGFDAKIPEVESVKTVQLELDSIMSERIHSDEYAMKYEVLPDGKENTREEIQGDIYIPLYELEEQESIELVTKLHEQSLNAEGTYLGWGEVSYEDGPFTINRRLNFRENSTDTLLTLKYSDEMLEKYNPFFELKPEYLEFVHITDKMGNLIGEGEISAEHWAELLEAIRSDLKNTDAAQLRDTDNNQEVAQLIFAAKYPKKIYEEYGELYHFDSVEHFIVRMNDSNTRQVLEKTGLDLQVQESFYDRLLSVNLGESYKSDLPGLARTTDMGIFEKYDYYLGENELTDPETMRIFVENATSVYNGYGDQYYVELFANNEDGIHISNMQYFIDRAIVAEAMVKNNDFVVPYILSHAEKDLLNKAEKDAPQIAENPNATIALTTPVDNVPKTEEYFSWKQVKTLENTVSMKAYCEQYCPQILEDKSAAELRCMEETPFLNADGSRITIGF